MNRREFVAKSCVACLGSAALSTLLSSCATARLSNATLEGNGLTVAKSEFTVLQNEKPVIRPFIIVSNAQVAYSIYVFRISEHEYSALKMICTHQGSELDASENSLSCSTHGSKFDRNGRATHGPAKIPLRRYPVFDRGETLFIDLS